VIQAPLGQFTSGLIQHRNLLVARVKITSYNHPAAAGSAPFFSSLGRQRYQVYSEEGADNVV
jgi:hypothetical protein